MGSEALVALRAGSQGHTSISGIPSVSGYPAVSITRVILPREFLLQDCKILIARSKGGVGREKRKGPRPHPTKTVEHTNG